MEKLGGQIKQLRLSKGMNQQRLAEAVGVTKASISDYERNKRYPPYNLLCSIAEALDVPEAELLSYMATKENDNKYVPKEYPIGSDYARLMQRMVAAFNRLSDEARKIAIERVEELCMIPKYQRTLANVLCHYISKRYHLIYEILNVGEKELQETQGDTKSESQKMPYEVQHIVLQREISSNTKKIYEFFYYSFNDDVDDSDIGKIFDTPVVRYETGSNLGFVFDDEDKLSSFYDYYVEHKGIMVMDGNAKRYNTQALFLEIEKGSFDILDVIEYDPSI